MSRARAWSLARVRLVERRVAEALRGLEDEPAVVHCLRSIADLEDEPGPLPALRRFYFALQAVDRGIASGGLDDRQGLELTRLAASLAKVWGVSQRSENLGFLHREVLLRTARLQARSGRTELGAWTLAHAERHASPIGEPEASLAAATTYLQAGELPAAEASLSRAASFSAESPLAAATILSARVHRLAGRIAAAQASLDALGEKGRLTAAERQASAWEAQSIVAARDGDLGPLVAGVRGGTGRAGTAALKAFLWSHAAQSRRWADRLPSLKSLGRSPVWSVDRHDPTYRLCLGLERGLDSGVPWESRLWALGALRTEIDGLRDVEERLLALAALARLLVRGRAERHLDLVLGQYQGLCRKLSAGASHDVLRVHPDLPS